MYNDDAENQKLGQDGGPAVPHNPLSPGEAVSLRGSVAMQPQTTESRAGYPGPAAPVAPPAAQASPSVPVAQPNQSAAVPSQNPSPAFFREEAQTAYQPAAATQPPSSYVLDEPESYDELEPQDDDTELEWTAAEFTAHPKNMVWYLALAGVTAVVVALAYLITHDFMTVSVIIICAVLFGYAAARQPRQLQYALSGRGIVIGPKFYPYKDFSSFAVVPEGATSSIDFMPLKRFSPILSVAYDPAHEADLMQVLSQHLPIAAHKRTAIDAFMHRIHF